MEMRCKKEPISSKGGKLMAFTKGKIYEFEQSEDPPGLITLDDNKQKEIFFDTSRLFETVK